jgi:hypothetical protein
MQNRRWQGADSGAFALSETQTKLRGTWGWLAYARAVKLIEREASASSGIESMPRGTMLTLLELQTPRRSLTEGKMRFSCALIRGRQHAALMQAVCRLFRIFRL